MATIQIKCRLKQKLADQVDQAATARQLNIGTLEVAAEAGQELPAGIEASSYREKEDGLLAALMPKSAPASKQ